METIFIDTHVALWLAAGEHKKITPFGKSKIENCTTLMSPAVLMELDMLTEKKLITDRQSILAYLTMQFGIGVANDPFLAIADKAAQFKWTRDPLDRLIVAHSALRKTPLLTKDHVIQKHFPQAIW